ncbi:unnamed protein product [Blepharisma stoltei]|uniref:Uncharacterized protein n=1 Tax=Blepharisma stoltei TaxID=1481888 RepID=A0AAU9J0J2_9CILI|nr:unnamed protein product [Blepharisma stoltei]
MPNPYTISLKKKNKSKSPKNSKIARERRTSQSSLYENIVLINEVASTIGKNSVCWSFSKADRFKGEKTNSGPGYIIIKSALGKARAAGIGYGKRTAPSNAFGKDSPPPTAYKLSSCFDKLGISTKISPSRSSHSRQQSTPGPGSYDVRSVGNSPSFSFKGRNFVKTRSETPPPGTYNPSHSLVIPSRYASIAFGRRTPHRNSLNDTPGPGTYDVITVAFIDKVPIRKKRRALSLDLSSIIQT